MSCSNTTPLVSRASSLILTTDSEVFLNLDFPSVVSGELNPASDYDSTQLGNITDAISAITSNVDLSNYPTLSNKLSQTPLTKVEVADFLTTTGFDPDIAEEDLNKFIEDNVIPPQTKYDANTNLPVFTTISIPIANILGQLDFYLDQNFGKTISAGFCSILANPFQNIMKLVAQIEIAKGLVNELSNFSLDDFLSGLAAKILGPLNQLKDMILGIVDSIKSNLTNMVENVKKKFNKIAKDLKAGAAKLERKINKMVNGIKDFFSDSSTATLKEKLEKLISGAASQFEKLTTDALAFLLFSFCKLTEGIQDFLKSPVDAFADFVQSISAASLAVENMSKSETQKAVEAGAVRISQEDVTQRQTQMRETINQVYKASQSAQTTAQVPSRTEGSITPTEQQTPAPVAVGSLPYIPSRELTDDERDALDGMNESGVPGFIRFEPSVQNMGKSVSDANDEDGWRQVDPLVWVKLLKIKARMGDMGYPLVINSAYRSPDYNKNIGGAKQSMHMSGKAVDVSTTFMTEAQKQQFIRYASEEGFGGIGVYATFVHVDLRPARVGWYKIRLNRDIYISLLKAHKRGDFVDGISRS